MKKIYLLLLAVVTLSFSGCEFKDPTDLIDIQIDYDIMDTYLGINILDAKTGAPIILEDGKTIKATLMGTDSEQIIEPSGTYNDVYETEIGVLSLAVNPSREVSSANPVVFKIKFDVEGYLSTTKSISIADTGFNSLSVTLLNLSSPPEGVSINSFAAVGTAENGTIKEDISIQSATEEFSAVIPQNTTVKDENGNPLVGELSMELVVFNAQSNAAMSLMPGGEGMSATAITESGETEEITFESAGFFNIDITDENGNSGTTFENGAVQIQVKANAEQVNGETGEKVKAGDKIGVWSFDEATQEWTYEKEAQFVEADGELVIETEIEHFSSWNFDWHFPGKCYTGGTFVFTSNNPELQNEFVYFTGSMYNAATGGYVRYFSLGGYINQPITVRNVPNMNLNLHFQTSSKMNVQVPGNENNVNLCTASNYEIPVIEKEVSKTQISIIGRCDNSDGTSLTVRPSYWFYYYDLDTYYFNWGRLQDGEVTLLGLEAGHRYLIYTYFDGWQSKEIVHDGRAVYSFDLDLPKEFCSFLGI